MASVVNKGIHLLSELNVLLALGLILFVLFTGNISFLLNALVLNIGACINHIMGSFAFDHPTG